MWRASFYFKKKVIGMYFLYRFVCKGTDLTHKFFLKFFRNELFYPRMCCWSVFYCTCLIQCFNNSVPVFRDKFQKIYCFFFVLTKYLWCLPKLQTPAVYITLENSRILQCTLEYLTWFYFNPVFPWHYSGVEICLQKFAFLNLM